jgi:hypothetical protein
MDKVGIIQVEDLDLGKHSDAQLRDYFEDIQSEKIRRPTEIPFRLNELLKETEGVIVLIDATGERYMDQVVKKIMDVEMQRGKPVQKLIVEKENESMEKFRKRTQEAARENSEKLADKIKNLREKE